MTEQVQFLLYGVMFHKFNSGLAQLVERSAVGHKVMFNREFKSHKAKINRMVSGSSPESGAC